MEIKNNDIFLEANNYLKQLYGEQSSFRDGQYEAIEAVVLGNKTLVVQKTGWGKSLVYFIATKLLKNKNNGVTLVVSPLLALMDNQNAAAKKLGLKTQLFNSTVRDIKEQILNDIDNNDLDLLLITPETLFSNDFKYRLPKLNISCFVIDEAHCISDWGHDFRLEYSKLNTIVKSLDDNIPILATTATANNRVVQDLKEKLNTNLHISRGTLQRDNIAIEIINFDDRTNRYAWLLKNLKLLPGVGIIYCLTQRDCDNLSNFLNENNYNTISYHSGIDDSELHIKLFEENKVKAIVSTIKLGMGYDKDDISFVIHFQQPHNLISYYQQIGRAGRNIPFSYAILMNDNSDKLILESFIESAFPTKEIMYDIVELLKEESLTLAQLQTKLNSNLSSIKKALMFLENDEFIQKTQTKYSLIKEGYTYDVKHYNDIKEARKIELDEMNKYLTTTECYSKYITNSLDDFQSKECGICSNCLKKSVFEFSNYDKEIDLSLSYLNKLSIPIIPKKQLPTRKKLPYILNEGICLSRYNEVGYGILCKDIDNNIDALLNKSVEILKPIILKNNIKYLANIKINDFSIKLAMLLNIQYIDLVVENKQHPQSLMENSIYQFTNAYRSYEIKDFNNIENVLLIDESITSGWTITVVGNKLMDKGVKSVTPYVLSSKAKW